MAASQKEENMVELREQLIFLLFIVILMLIAPLVLIALDFWSGIRKAKKRGVPIHSDKMKRTIDKASRYYNGIFAMMVLDVIQIAMFVFLHLFNGWGAWTVPVFTLIAVGFVAAIEIKSIYEPADVKEQREKKDVIELAKAIAAHRNDPEEIAEAVAKYLTKNGTEA
jgi:hypothetical protein